MRKGKKFKGGVKIRHDLFFHLPPEIIIDIISRLPVRSILRCKCVCKSWVDLLKTPEFVKSHLSKSVPGIISFECFYHLNLHTVVEFVDEPDLNRRRNSVFIVDLPSFYGLHSSVNGLISMRISGSVGFAVCNPITREYIQLPPRTESFYKPGGSSVPVIVTFGFGVSMVSGQYKVVRMLLNATTARKSFDIFECLVYTVGTGSWRRIPSSNGRIYMNNDVGSFLNGNLHWFTTDLKGKAMISCFDLETELFNTFSAPFDKYEGRARMSPLGDCLCLCHTSFHGYHDTSFDIWLMKEYGNAESWTKQIHIGRSPDFNITELRPIILFENGDMLMENMRLLHYSSKTKTVRQVDATGLDTEDIFHAVFYAPSFVPLGTYAMENVLSF